MRLVAAIAVIVQALATLRTGPTTQVAILDVLALVAGLLMLAGLWTPVAGSLVAVLGLYRAVSQPDDLWTNILLATIGIALALLGPGAWSIDAWLFGWKRIDVRDQLKK